MGRMKNTEDNDYQPSTRPTESPMNTSGPGNLSKPLMSERLLVKFWKKMGELYGSRWIGVMGEVGGDAFQTWKQGLYDLNGRQIGRGIARCVDSREDWPPSLPQFRRYCLGDAEALGLPPVFIAYKEATEFADYDRRQTHRWSHPAVYVAAKETGFHDLKTMPQKQSYKRFEYCYKVACNRVAGGEDLNAEIPKALPKPDENKLSHEAWLAMLREKGYDIPPGM